MKKIILIVCCILLTICSNAQSVDFQWAKKFTGSSSGQSIAVDLSGNTYLTGYFNDTTDFDPGVGVLSMVPAGGGGDHTDIFVSKLDRLGNLLWVKQIGDTFDDEGLSLAIDISGNVYITGYFQGTVDFDPGPGTYILNTKSERNIFISKLDPSGNFLWAKSMDGGSGSGNAITLDYWGNVYTTGIFKDTVDFDPGTGTNTLYSSNGQMFISKLDAVGNFLWAKQLGAGGFPTSTAIVVDGGGYVYTTGHLAYGGLADFDPGIGVDTLNSLNGAVFISKLDVAGNFVWAKQIGNGSSFGNSITLDSARNVYITGRFSSSADFDPGSGIYNLNGTGAGNTDIFISKLDAAGNFVWAKQMGGNMRSEGIGIALDAFRNVYVTGYFEDTVDFDPGTGTYILIANSFSTIFISKLDASGNFIWAKSMDDALYIPGYSAGNCITLDRSGNIYTTGYFNGKIDFDPGPSTYNLTNYKLQEVFIQKMSQTVTSLTELSLSDRIAVYPNPSAGDYELRYQVQSNEPLQFTVRDITGRVLLQTSLLSNQNTYNINAGNWTAGVYMYQLRQDGITTVTGKLIKE
jgi:hypothetical protein